MMHFKVLEKQEIKSKCSRHKDMIKTGEEISEIQSTAVILNLPKAVTI